MKQTINIYDFENAFRQHRREDQFSYKGLRALFKMLESYEEDTGEEIELDVISLCCEYTEYENMEEFWGFYDKEDFPNDESIMDSTHYWHIEDTEGFIIGNF
tara:strand:- start:150 stop:455 length:306 start_codon:yes stop_codon:yes gene_type:complete